MSGTFLAAPAIAGVIGFSTSGPVAGSVAASWQASMPLVQVGSQFAWWQSAAMGGAAVGGIAAGAGMGAGVAGLASVAAFLGGDGTKEMFERVVLKGIPSVKL